MRLRDRERDKQRRVFKISLDGDGYLCGTCPRCGLQLRNARRDQGQPVLIALFEQHMLAAGEELTDEETA